MDKLLRVIRDFLQNVVDKIDEGKSTLTKETCEAIIDHINDVAITEEKLSKYQACRFLNMSRATFDNHVRSGRLPRGRKQQGFKELFYYKRDLEKFLK
jgi:predicted DNA-binding protein